MKTIDIANGQYVCEVNSATGKDKKKIRIGDIVRCYTADNKPLNTVMVRGIRKQGNGVVLAFKEAPDNEYPHHFEHMAKYASKLTA